MALTKIDDRGLKTPIDLLDNEKIRFGTGNDLEIYHNGSHSILTNSTGNIYLDPASSERGIVIIGNGAVELYHDGNKKFETTSTGAQFSGQSGSHTDVTILGYEGLDGILNLYADEGDDNADKWRILSSTDGSFYLQNYTSGSWEKNLKATGNAGVDLYYDNSKKFEITSAGITITGAQTTNSGGTTNVMNCGSTDTALKLNSTNANGPHIRFQYDGTDLHYVGSGQGFTPSADREDFAIRFKDRFFFSRDNTNCWYIDGDMHFIPASNNTYDIGRSDTRVRNIYTQDLQLSNKAKKDTGGNDVDGTWGDYTIQEGESDLFLINNRSGKKYKFNLTEVL